MNNLDFDNSGYLLPYELVNINWQDLEEEFVFSHRRAEIFLEFKTLITHISSKLTFDFNFWIDGSFATLKSNPNDMDLVCFVDYRDYVGVQTELADLKKQFTLLDIYFVKNYPVSHPSYFLTNFDQVDWLFFLTRDRQNRKKGILNLVIER